METSQSEIFLYELMGYRRLSELLKEEDIDSVDFKEFFRGTLFGTFRPYPMFRKKHHRKIITPSKVHRLEDFDVEKTTPELYTMSLKDDEYKRFEEWVTSSKHAESGLKYIIVNRTLFWYHRPEEVLKVFEHIAEQLFPDAEIVLKKTAPPKSDKNSQTHFLVEMEDDGFILSVYSQIARIDNRRLTASFNARDSVADDINRMALEYYKGFVFDRDAAPEPDRMKVYPNLLSEIKDLSSIEAEKVLDGCEAEGFSIHDSFQEGNVINHPKYGRGLVVSTSPDRIEVFFPNRDKVILVHNRK